MKAKDVVIGGTYVVKVSDKLAKVRIVSAHASGQGWVGQNLETGRQVRIKSPQRPRAEVKAPTAPQGACVAKKTEGKSKGGKGQKKATRAKTARQGQKGGMSGLDAAAKVLE